MSTPKNARPSNEGEMQTPKVEGTLNTFIPLNLKKRSGRVVVEPPEEAARLVELPQPQLDTTLINGLARAFYWQRLIDQGIVRSGQEIAKKEGLDQATVNECMRLTLLDPLLVEGILKGIHPKGLTLSWLTRNPIPLIWGEQHERFRELAAG